MTLETYNYWLYLRQIDHRVGIYPLRSFQDEESEMCPEFPTWRVSLCMQRKKRHLGIATARYAVLVSKQICVGCCHRTVCSLPEVVELVHSDIFRYLLCCSALLNICDEQQTGGCLIAERPASVAVVVLRDGRLIVQSEQTRIDRRVYI